MIALFGVAQPGFGVKVDITKNIGQLFLVGQLNLLLKQSKAVKQQIHSDIDFFSSIIIGYNI